MMFVPAALIDRRDYTRVERAPCAIVRCAEGHGGCEHRSQRN
jgi:hypothetical protein